MGQIEKLAIAWVFRASDRNNYYATKLVEMGRGPVPGLSLLRYAVIKSHQRMKVQLPLPVLPGGKSMHRIRQEIRGTQFTAFLDCRLIDSWSDPSLGSWRCGLFSDPGEVACFAGSRLHQDDARPDLCLACAAPPVNRAARSSHVFRKSTDGFRGNARVKSKSKQPPPVSPAATQEGFGRAVALHLDGKSDEALAELERTRGTGARSPCSMSFVWRARASSVWPRSSERAAMAPCDWG